MKEAQTTQEALNAALKEAQAWKAAALAAQTERDALAAQVDVLQQAITDSTRYLVGSLPADFQWPPFLSRNTDALAEIRKAELWSLVFFGLGALMAGIAIGSLL